MENAFFKLKQIQEMYLHLIKDSQSVHDLSSTELRCLKLDISSALMKCKYNEGYTYPNLSILTNSVFSTADIIVDNMAITPPVRISTNLLLISGISYNEVKNMYAKAIRTIADAK